MTLGTRALRETAFGDPDRGVPPSPCPAGADPATGWLNAVALGVEGRYAAAASLLEPLCRGRDRLVAALACAALAAHRRQLGGHGAALPWDGAAVRHAAAAGGTGRLRGSIPTGDADPDGLDPPGALADGLLGLAADNLALGRLSTARTHLDTATALPAGWRAEVRAGWVHAELALASGQAADAVPPAERALRRARLQGAVRHRTKSALVLAAALAASGGAADRDRAAGLVRDVLAGSGARGWRSLSWPARSLAAGLHPERADRYRAEVTDELYGVLLSTDPVGRRCARRSGWVPI